MNYFFPFLFFTFFLLTFSACTYSIHQVHVSDFQLYTPFEEGRIIKASSEQFVVLGFAYDTNYVDRAYRKLLAKCPKNSITGITTQYSSSHGFFSWNNKILMQGLCHDD